MADFEIGKDNPYRLLHHISHLIPEKVKVLEGRLVRPTMDGCLDAASQRPGGSFDGDGSATTTKVTEQLAC